MKERIDQLNDTLYNLLHNFLPNIKEESLISILITAVAATILAVIVFIIIRVFTKFVEKRILSLHFEKLKSLKFQNQEILTGNQITSGIGKFFNWIRYIAYIIIFYLYLNLVFSFFPQTRGISAALLDHFIGAVSFILGAAWGYLPNLLTLFVIFVFGYY